VGRRQVPADEARTEALLWVRTLESRRSDRGRARGLLRVLVKDLGGGTTFANLLTNVKGTLYFRNNASDGSGYELWISNGTELGTRLLKDIHPSGDSYPDELTAVGNVLFFRADDGSHGVELWKRVP